MFYGMILPFFGRGKMTGRGGFIANNSRDGMRWVMSHEYARSGHISRPVAGILEHLERGGGPGRLDHLILCSFWGGSSSTEPGQDG